MLNNLKDSSNEKQKKAKQCKITMSEAEPFVTTLMNDERKMIKKERDIDNI